MKTLNKNIIIWSYATNQHNVYLKKKELIESLIKENLTEAIYSEFKGAWFYETDFMWEVEDWLNDYYYNIIYDIDKNKLITKAELE